MTDRYPIVYTRRARYRGASIFFTLFVLLVVGAAILAYWYVAVPVAILIAIVATVKAVRSHPELRDKGDHDA